MYVDNTAYDYIELYHNNTDLSTYVSCTSRHQIKNRDSIVNSFYQL